MQNNTNKIKEFINNLKLKLQPKLSALDLKFAALMPDFKLRKIVYITMGSLISFMILIILLGILVSPLRNRPVSSGTTLNKPNIVNVTSVPEDELSETQKKLKLLEEQIRNLKFPESNLNIPVIEFDIKI